MGDGFWFGVENCYLSLSVLSMVKQRQAHIQDFAQGGATAKTAQRLGGPMPGVSRHPSQKPKTLRIWFTIFSWGPFTISFSDFYYSILSYFTAYLVPRPSAPFNTSLSKDEAFQDKLM